MFEIMFGLIWTAISLLIFIVMLSTGSVFGILFMLIFVAIGLFVLWTGVKKLKANKDTDIHGVETYGIVVDIRPSGSSVNGRDILNADVVIVEETGVTGRYTESIGTSYNKYRIGEYVFVKYYNDDINIINKAEATIVPEHIKEKLASEGYIGGQVPYMQDGYMGGQVPYMQNGYMGGQMPYMQNGYMGGQMPYAQNNYMGGQAPYMQNGYMDGQMPMYDSSNDPRYQVYNNGIPQNTGAQDTVVIDGVEYVKKQ